MYKKYLYKLALKNGIKIKRGSYKNKHNTGIHLINSNNFALEVAINRCIYNGFNTIYLHSKAIYVYY